MTYPSSFVAIDFETANRYPNSACAIGMVKVIDNVIIDQYYSLICPPYMVFEPGNVRVHGIKPADVANEPDFKALWPKISEFIGDLPMVAHNAPFDKKVLHSVLEFFNIQIPDNIFFCTVRISKKAFPQLTSHRLSAMAEYLDLPLNHHQALDDARVCAEILITVNLAD